MYIRFFKNVILPHILNSVSYIKFVQVYKMTIILNDFGHKRRILLFHRNLKPGKLFLS